MRSKQILSLVLAACCALSLTAAPAKKKGKKKREYPKHMIDIYAGGGVSSMTYNADGCNIGIGASFTAGATYTWFFRPWMGLQTGLSFTRVASTLTLTNQMTWTTAQDGSQLTDNMGDAYIHYANFDNWKEQQQSYLFEVPIGLRFKYRKEYDAPVGLHAGVGLKLAIPVYSNYAHTKGSVIHSGFYEQYQLLLTPDYYPEYFKNEPFTVKQEESLGSKLNIVNAEAYAEIGPTIRVGEQTELVIAGYAQYMLNDFCSVKAADRTQLGFANSNNNYTFMNEYKGLVGTDKIGSMHPWVAGVKLGVSLSTTKTTKQKKKLLRKLAKEFPDYLPPRVVHDTILIFDTLTLTVEKQDTVYVRDTIREVTKQEKVMEQMLSESVIWFNFDSYDPILEPAYILDSVATIMRSTPDVRIHINGHACTIGGDSYNQRLALKRARAVAALLKKKGVKEDRMSVMSFGASHPYRYNAAHQLEKDRRVEIIPEGFVLQENAQQAAKQRQEQEQALEKMAEQEQKPAPQPKQVQQSKQVQQPVAPKGNEYTAFLGTEKLKAGSRLAQVSRRWYGETIFWIYIYEANKDKIDNPQQVSKNLVLRIPDLKKTVHKGMTKDQALQDARRRINNLK